MTDSEKDLTRRELDHALAALSDGFGHAVWGPGVVLTRLDRRNTHASAAFEAAVLATHDLLHRVKRERAIPAIKALAPVLLELLLSDE
jgi:hypothetical protein